MWKFPFFFIYISYFVSPLSDFLLSLWMTGNKDIKLNFMSSHSILMSAESTTIFEKAAIHPMCFYLNFWAYSASILLLASTKWPYFSRKSIPFWVWTAIWSYWSWKINRLISEHVRKFFNSTIRNPSLNFRQQYRLRHI